MPIIIDGKIVASASHAPILHVRALLLLVIIVLSSLVVYYLHHKLQHAVDQWVIWSMYVILFIGLFYWVGAMVQLYNYYKLILDYGWVFGETLP